MFQRLSLEHALALFALEDTNSIPCTVAHNSEQTGFVYEQTANCFALPPILLMLTDSREHGLNSHHAACTDGAVLRGLLTLCTWLVP